MDRIPMYGTKKISPIPGCFPYKERVEQCYVWVDYVGETWYCYDDNEYDARRQWAVHFERLGLLLAMLPEKEE
ncbi:hypothetical protein LCGC14_1770090 [marine sediment metagenome]|uniref:Uncharacterized protein n=1 Tax=marine sediment metagenome TaxID=412755 RepID=A0A0F9JY92_9ZZZZ